MFLLGKLRLLSILGSSIDLALRQITQRIIMLSRCSLFQDSWPVAVVFTERASLRSGGGGLSFDGHAEHAFVCFGFACTSTSDKGIQCNLEQSTDHLEITVWGRMLYSSWADFLVTHIQPSSELCLLWGKPTPMTLARTPQMETSLWFSGSLKILWIVSGIHPEQMMILIVVYGNWRKFQFFSGFRKHCQVMWWISDHEKCWNEHNIQPSIMLGFPVMFKKRLRVTRIVHVYLAEPCTDIAWCFDACCMEFMISFADHMVQSFKSKEFYVGLWFGRFLGCLCLSSWSN